MIPRGVLQAARELRAPRRTRSGVRLRPWPDIAAELERRGLGRYSPRALAAEAAAAPLEQDPAAPLAPAEVDQVEASFRAAWAEERPGREWPGLEAARRELLGR